MLWVIFVYDFESNIWVLLNDKIVDVQAAYQTAEEAYETVKYLEQEGFSCSVRQYNEYITVLENKVITSA